MLRIDLRKYYKFVLVFLVFVYLHGLRFLNYVNLNASLYSLSSYIIAFLIVALCILSIGPKRIPGRFWVLGFIFVPVLSFIPCWLENGQGLVASAKAYSSMLIALSYFLLHHAKFKESDIVSFITVVAVVRVLITIIQQFTFPDYLFCFKEEGLNASGSLQSLEVRSGFIRFGIEDTYLSMFLVFYYLNRLLKQVNYFDFFLFLTGIIGVYIDQTRQLMVSTLLAIIIVLLFFSKNRYKWIILGLIIVISIVIIINADVLFGDLIGITMDDLNSNNIRILAYTTFLFEFWGGPLSLVFGNGPVHWASPYGMEVAYYQDYLKLFRNDVGIVGAMNMYGIVTIVFLLAFFVFFVFRYWRAFRPFLKMYFIAMIINLPMICFLTQHHHWWMYLGFMLFFCDNDIKRYNFFLAFKRTRVAADGNN